MRHQNNPIPPAHRRPGVESAFMRRDAIVPAILVTLVPSASRQIIPPSPSILEVKYTQFTLPNGLHVTLHEDHSVPSVSVNVWYHVVFAREVTERTGFAHLFDHLMFMRSGHVKPAQIDESLESARG